MIVTGADHGGVELKMALVNARWTRSRRSRVSSGCAASVARCA